MRPFLSRRVIVLWVAVALGAGSLLVAGSALADKALFRVQQAWLDAPDPPVTTPGNAGKAMDPLTPPTYWKATYNMPTYYRGAAVATVQPGNPVGSPFTLPVGVIQPSKYLCSFCSSSGPPGYFTTSFWYGLNVPAYFGPQHTHTGTTLTRIVFPTTGGNTTYPNYGLGKPNLPTTGGGLCLDGNPPPVTTIPGGGCGTAPYGGRYDFSRMGSIRVTPGPNQFGGTFRIFYREWGGWFQSIWKFSPVFYHAYGDFKCLDNGRFGQYPGASCTGQRSDIADVTQSRYGARYLLGDDWRKATRSIVNSTWPTPNGLKSWVAQGIRSLNLIHPWTTGYARVDNPGVFTTRITPRASGYDKDLGGVSLTVTETNWWRYYNYTAQTAQTNITTMKSYLQNVGRVVSLVQPRLVHGYMGPLDPTTDAVQLSWSAARMRLLKVFFLPEPTAMLLLGTGIATLLGLSRMRRR